MSEFKEIKTQEELDRIIQERLNRQKETLEKQYSDYEQLKARNATLETEVSTLQSVVEDSKKTVEDHDKTVSDLNAQIAGYETANLRTKIALQNGLPFDLAERLVGNDEESIKADAERLAAFVKPKNPVPPMKQTEPDLGDGKDGAYKELIKNLNLEGE